MAPETLSPAGVYCQCFRIVWVIYGWSVAVFTLNDFMGRIEKGLNIFFMAFLAILLAPVFYLEVFPFIGT
jgi:hypothetical protein